MISAARVVDCVRWEHSSLDGPQTLARLCGTLSTIHAVYKPSLLNVQCKPTWNAYVPSMPAS